MSLYIFILSWQIFFNPLEINQEQDEVILNMQDLYSYEDKHNRLTFSDVKSAQFYNNFTQKPDFEPDDYNRNSTYWIKLNFVLPQYDGNYILEFYDQTIDSINVYIRQNNGLFRKYNLGDAYPFSSKSIKHKNFDLTLEADSEYEAYIQVKNSQYADIRIAIKRIDRFIQYSLSEYFLYGIFYGMILIISLNNLLIYLAIREIKYVYYTFYILSVGFYALCIDGIAYQYLWPEQPKWNQLAYGVALYAIIFWSTIFSIHFLKTKIRAPRLHKLIIAVLAIRSSLFIYSLFFNPSLFRFRNIEIILLSLIFISSIFVFRRGYKPARFFVVAYGILFLGFLMRALINWSIIPFNTFNYYSLHLGFILEMIFLTFALSDRVRILKTNRDRALKRIVTQHEQNVKVINRINKGLEKKVEERTRDLHQKNSELEETNKRINTQSREIAEINSMLDLDNWRLQNDIKKIQRERLMHKNINFEEFIEIFTTKEQCLEILASFKWKEGYECQKCNNTKYHFNETNLARRCTKCGYNESPTAFTIFKGIKFDLTKAFFIVYSHLNEDRYTLDELAEIMKMRRNTIWEFKKKVEEEIENNGKSYLNNMLHFGYEKLTNFTEIR
ncbi:7TM diverse intracellular signaling domain-containing protein [Marivirga sp.]|uniref:7TM diverse intracellular signaling domain-containing protein n=1 Tax=Marivirga sp. TaxID=2018662 RepID=UPI002D7E3F0A|nr:7TM diverse intracellular signaling domain-containing protein [Marivirga sp.]HET8859549.1 7TM diverse intracellular signaling domain-containing protein [Marivirga sp.]